MHPYQRAANPCTCDAINEASEAINLEAQVYLLVISKVVPNIWARTNSAILTVCSQLPGIAGVRNNREIGRKDVGNEKQGWKRG